VTDALKWLDAQTIPDEPVEDHVSERLRQALRTLHEFDPSAAGPGDLAGLLRHYLRRAVEHRQGGTGLVRVPVGEAWPTRDTWLAHGFEVVTTSATHLRLLTKPWIPDWLPDVDEESPFAAAFAGEHRRPAARVRCDPGLSRATGFETYYSPGQRAAVRAAFCSHPSASVLLLLPTGGGKSLAAFAPALLAPSGRTVLVVVPTVALAMDQERQYRRIVRGGQGKAVEKGLPPLAYWGNMPGDDKRALLRRLGEGVQPLVFAAPESFDRSLRGPLFKAARAGRLSHFVVDEAHLVAQWGKEFRPEFQTLAPLRRALLAECPRDAPFRTLLMSATVTEEAWSALDLLFAAPTPLEVVSAAHLRPEPSYWVRSEATAEVRIERVLEVLRHAPRPIILYVSLPEHAKAWVERIRAEGIQRVDGAVGGEVTQELVRRWSHREIDIMVATSAFGLGVDQSDVQVVVHACLPETVDRYYQEVGRGGRDGRASVSILVHEPGDDAIATTLNKNTIVGVDTGLDRWMTMFRDAEHLQDGAWRVPADALRSALQQPSESNVMWNIRTLILMARSGLLQLETAAPPAPERAPGLTDEEYEEIRNAAYEQYWNSLVVRLVDAGHARREVWKQKVERERARSKRSDEQLLERMAEILHARRPYHAIFADTYTVSVEGERSVSVDVVVPPSRCPVTRRDGVPIGPRFDLPIPPPIRRVAPASEALRAICVDGPPLLVTYKPDQWDDRSFRALLQTVLKRLAHLGVLEFATPDGWLDSAEAAAVAAEAPARFVAWRPPEEPEDEEWDWHLPRVSVASPGDAAGGRVLTWLGLDRDPHIIVTSSRTPDAHGRLLCDRGYSLSFEAFARSIDRCPS
jgi:ATP-dependent DNA helicase RecQ